MAIAFDAASDAGKTAAGTTLTWAHTCGGADRLLLVGVATPITAGASGVTYNTDALTKLNERIDASAAMRIAVWYRVAPDVGAANIVVTLTGAVACAAGAASYTGVHQLTPLGPTSSNTGSGTTVTVDVASALGEFAHDFIAVNTTSATVTATAGQTSRWNRLAAAVTAPRIAGSTKTGALLTTMSWTISAGSAWVVYGVAIYPSLSGLQVLIADVDQTAKVRTSAARKTLRLNLSLGSQWSADFPVIDTDSTASAYRPQIDDAVLIRKDGQRVFKGTIVQVRDEPLGGTQMGVLTSVSAKAGNPITHQVQVNEQFPAGQTLHDVVASLVSTYLTSFGIILDPAMATGPTLEVITFDRVLMAEALNYLQSLTGWLWRLTPDDVLEMFAAGTKTALFDFDATTTYGPVTWEQGRAVYVNRVHLRFGGTSSVTKTWSVVGDGSTDTWELEYLGAQTSDGHLLGGFVTDSDLASDLPVGVLITDPSAFWDFSPSTNEMVRVFGDLPNLDTATMEYATQFPQVVTVEDAGEIAANGVWEATFDAPDIFDTDEALAFAEGLLRRHVETPKKATVTAWDGFELPGTSIVMDFPDRLVEGDYLITQVSCQDILNGELECTYTCLEGTEAQRSWTDALKAALGGGGGPVSGGTVSGTLVPPSSTGAFAGDVIAHLGSAFEARLGTAGVYERGRAVPMGEWILVAFSAGNFTANGTMTWTVESGDQNTYRYALDGSTMVLSFKISTSTVVAPLNTTLRLAIPGGYVVATAYTTSGALDYYQGTWVKGSCEAASGEAYIRLFTAGFGSANWAASTNLTYLQGQIIFQVM